MLNKTFIRITNQMIYDKIVDARKDIVETKEHVIATNGKVATNKWIACSALTLAASLGSILLVYKIW